jgi:hypothetical protein
VRRVTHGEAMAGEAGDAGDAGQDVEVAPAVVGGTGESGGKGSGDLLTKASMPRPKPGRQVTSC